MLLKKAECWRIDASELCWRRPLRVPWTARRSKQSFLKEMHLFFFFFQFYLFIYFNFILFFKLYITVLVLPNIKMNPPQVYMCSPSWTLLPPLSPHHPSGSSQCTRIFTGRTDTEVEAPTLWPPDGKCWLIRKDPDAGKDWRQEEKGTTEDEMVGWHHQLNGPEFG